MILAKNNIVVQLKNVRSPEYALFNPISGCFDLMDETEHVIYQQFRRDGFQSGAPSHFPAAHKDFVDYLRERGYAYESPEAEEKAICQALETFNQEIANSPVQLMLVPTYDCNLNCTYCFQQGINSAASLISRETVDAFFSYADDNFGSRNPRPFITLFGGEPLAYSKKQYDIISYIVRKCIERDFELSVVTNGYHLLEYMDLLKSAKIKELQVTLDGSSRVHDSRRATANQEGTFERIVLGMQAAIEAGMPINLRSVVDSENIEDIVHLAEFLDQKGWLSLPPERFKTQIGRNYELFECYAKPQHLMSEIQLWSTFAHLSKQHPILAKLHRPDFKGIRHLVDTGELYLASFDTCPACKTEWVFDLHGKIYGCTASCGREEYLLGTYWPSVELNTRAIETWQQRNVRTIPKCRNCQVDVVCGGGCGVVAANKNQGNILSPDCRPIQEIFDIGVNHYYKELVSGSQDSSQSTSCSCSSEIKKQAEKSCCAKSAEPKKKTASSPNPLDTSLKTEGCLICGGELIYAPTKQPGQICALCHGTFDAAILCIDGHFICDSCHRGGILGKVLQLLQRSTASNPVELAKIIFDLPELNMHGPEYHSIVPAILVTAIQNQSGIRDEIKINEALKRGQEVKGGNCGRLGACGAAIGAGIAVSVLESATSTTGKPRGNANLATGSALLEIGKVAGPRCCKRESILTIESFIKSSGYFDKMTPVEFTCKQFHKNRDCIKSQCKYFPSSQQHSTRHA